MTLRAHDRSSRSASKGDGPALARVPARVRGRYCIPYCVAAELRSPQPRAFAMLHESSPARSPNRSAIPRPRLGAALPAGLGHFRPPPGVKSGGRGAA